MSSIERKISRNILKKQQGNNRIQEEWQNFISFKYSPRRIRKFKKKK